MVRGGQPGRDGAGQGISGHQVVVAEVFSGHDPPPGFDGPDFIQFDRSLAGLVFGGELGRHVTVLIGPAVKRSAKKGEHWRL